MKKYLKEIYDEKEHDGFVFILDNDEKLDISAFTYKDNAEAIEKHDIGYKYHIITYKETVDGEVVEPDMFEAIIGDPHHYIANLLKCGFFGTICKKTKTSKKLVDGMFEDLLNMVADEEFEFAEWGVKMAVTVEVKRCSCTGGKAAEYQDLIYGKGMRVMNEDQKKGYNCTVCGAKHK